MKCVGPRNVADALTKSLPRPAFAAHRDIMWGTRTPFSAFYSRSFVALTAAAAAGKPLARTPTPLGTPVDLTRTPDG